MQGWRLIFLDDVFFLMALLPLYWYITAKMFFSIKNTIIDICFVSEIKKLFISLLSHLHCLHRKREMMNSSTPLSLSLSLAFLFILLPSSSMISSSKSPLFPSTGVCPFLSWVVPSKFSENISREVPYSQSSCFRLWLCSSLSPLVAWMVRDTQISKGWVFTRSLFLLRTEIKYILAGSMSCFKFESFLLFSVLIDIVRFRLKLYLMRSVNDDHDFVVHSW